MGYYIYQHRTHFLMHKKNFEAALAAIKQMLDPAFMAKHAGGSSNFTNEQGVYVSVPHYSFVETDEVRNAKTLAEAFKAWNWNPDTNDAGDIAFIDFVGEKSGDYGVFFDVIAPFVDKGCYIEMRGDDDAIWQWYFNGKHCEEQWGEVKFQPVKPKKDAKPEDPQLDLFDKGKKP